MYVCGLEVNLSSMKEIAMPMAHNSAKLFDRTSLMVQRGQKTSQDVQLQEGAVHTPGPVGLERSIVGANRKEDFTGEREVSLIEKVVERENLLTALRRVEQNKGAAGMDGMQVVELRSWF